MGVLGTVTGVVNGRVAELWAVKSARRVVISAETVDELAAELPAALLPAAAEDVPLLDPEELLHALSASAPVTSSAASAALFDLYVPFHQGTVRRAVGRLQVGAGTVRLDVVAT
jgi:hypothetical protein